MTKSFKNRSASRTTIKNRNGKTSPNKQQKVTAPKKSNKPVVIPKTKAISKSPSPLKSTKKPSPKLASIPKTPVVPPTTLQKLSKQKSNEKLNKDAIMSLTQRILKRVQLQAAQIEANSASKKPTYQQKTKQSIPNEPVSSESSDIDFASPLPASNPSSKQRYPSAPANLFTSKITFENPLDSPPKILVDPKKPRNQQKSIIPLKSTATTTTTTTASPRKPKKPTKKQQSPKLLRSGKNFAKYNIDELLPPFSSSESIDAPTTKKKSPAKTAATKTRKSIAKPKKSPIKKSNNLKPTRKSNAKKQVDDKQQQLLQEQQQQHHLASDSIEFESDPSSTTQPVNYRGVKKNRAVHDDNEADSSYNPNADIYQPLTPFSFAKPTQKQNKRRPTPQSSSSSDSYEPSEYDSNSYRGYDFEYEDIQTESNHPVMPQNKPTTAIPQNFFLGKKQQHLNLLATGTTAANTIKKEQDDIYEQNGALPLSYNPKPILPYSFDNYFDSIKPNEPQQQQHIKLDETTPSTSIVAPSSKREIDIVFCVDTTSSMGEYLRGTIDQIAAIYKKTQPFSQVIDVKYGVVCYRDHPPEESSYLYRINNLTTPLQTIQFIQKQDAAGGGDTPEAVMDGLYVATAGINWRTNSRKYIIHIADAPPHGDIYTGTSGGFLQRSFVWHDGCPCGLSIEKIARIMNSLKIHYRLIRAGDNMSRMAKIFRSCIQHYADIKVSSPKGLDFILSDMIAKQCLTLDDIQNDVHFEQNPKLSNAPHNHNRHLTNSVQLLPHAKKPLTSTKTAFEVEDIFEIPKKPINQRQQPIVFKAPFLKKKQDDDIEVEERQNNKEDPDTTVHFQRQKLESHDESSNQCEESFGPIKIRGHIRRSLSSIV